MPKKKKPKPKKPREAPGAQPEPWQRLHFLYRIVEKGGHP